jgi:uncharacterized protein (TIGR02246 family)
MTSNVTQAGVGTTQEQAEAKAVVDGVAAAWKDNNPDGFADAYTADASLILSGDRFLQGREMIRAVITQKFKAGHKGTTLLQNIVDLRFPAPSTAVVITEGGVLAPGESEPAPERAIRATWVLVKEDGNWLITAYQNTRNADQALPGA